MELLMEWIDMIEDVRQERKVRHKLRDIIVIVLFATLGNANEWEEIAFFASSRRNYLKKYIELKNGIPSHDTIRRVMGLINPASFQQLQNRWNELLSSNKGEKLKKIINIDGKTMRSNKRNGSSASHVVSAWSKEDGYCLGQNVVGEKSNEIIAIPELLETIQIKGSVITIDAMGTQKEIAKQIRKKKADYVLALKGNQGILHEQVKEYFEDKEFKKQICELGNYKKTVEKAHGQIETREYYQTNEIGWIEGVKKWNGIRSIGMIEKRCEKNGKTGRETRYYISSLEPEIELFERAVRGHWSIEIMHWHLDVTFREDYNTTIDKTASLNQNIMRKWCLSILKLIEVRTQKTSLKLKRFAVSLDPEKYLEEILKI